MVYNMLHNRSSSQQRFESLPHGSSSAKAPFNKFKPRLVIRILLKNNLNQIKTANKRLLGF